MVCFEMPGMGQFLPGEGAVPNIGAVGKLERVPEMRVEVLCVGKDVMTGAVDSLKRQVLTLIPVTIINPVSSPLFSRANVVKNNSYVLQSPSVRGGFI